MGMIIKVYIGDLDREVNIATLNSDDNDTQSVTITSKLIKDSQVAVKNNESRNKHDECKTSCVNIEKTVYERSTRIEDESINQEKITPDNESPSVINKSRAPDVCFVNASGTISPKENMSQDYEEENENFCDEEIESDESNDSTEELLVPKVDMVYKGVCHVNIDEMLKCAEFNPVENNTDSNERDKICGDKETRSSTVIDNTENNTADFDFSEDDADSIGFSTEVSDEALGSIVSFLDQNLSQDENNINVQRVVNGNVKSNSKVAEVPEEEMEPIVRRGIEIKKSDNAIESMLHGNTETASSKENKKESNIRENEPVSTYSSHNETELDLPEDDVSDTTNQIESNTESDLQTCYESNNRNKKETTPDTREQYNMELISRNEKDKKFDSHKNNELNSSNGNEIQPNSHVDNRLAENNKNCNDSSTVPHSDDQKNVNRPVFTFFGNVENIADEVNVLLHGITERDFQKDNVIVEEPRTTNIAVGEMGAKKTQENNGRYSIGVENLQSTHANKTNVGNNSDQGTATDHIQETKANLQKIVPENSANLCDKSAEATSENNVQSQPPEKESDKVTSSDTESIIAERESINCITNTSHESGYAMTFVQNNSTVQWNVSFNKDKPDSVLGIADECILKANNSMMVPSIYKSCNNNNFLNKVSDGSKRKRKTELVSSVSTNCELDINQDNVVDDLSDVYSDCDQQLEEYFVVDKVLGSRFNHETNLCEFLLKPKTCAAKDEPWSPIVDPKTCVVSLMDYGRLFIQSTEMSKCAKRKKQARQSTTRNPQVSKRVLEKRLVNVMVESKSDKDFDLDNGYCSSLTHSQIVDVPNEKSTNTCDVTADKNNKIAIENTNSGNCVSPVEMKPFNLGGDPLENGLAETVDTLANRMLRQNTKVGRKRGRKPKRKIQTAAVGKHSCAHCGFKANTSVHLESHVNKMHTQKPVLCLVCSKPYKYETSLIRHMKTHESDHFERLLRNSLDSVNVLPKQEVENEENGLDVTPLSPASNELSLTKMSRQKRNLVRDCNDKRKRSISPEVDIPKRIFISPSNKFEIKENKLPKVKKTVTFTSDLHFPDDIEVLENPTHVSSFPGQKQYACKMCHLEFGSKATLTRHLRIHSESSLFKCSECHRLFATHGELVVHKKVHKTVQRRSIQLPVVLLHRLPF